MKRRALSLVVAGVALILASCGPDRRRDECIAAHPNFVVLITAPSGKTLPADLVVTLHYGGSGVETYELNQAGKQQVLFCKPAGLDGGLVLVPDGGSPSSVEALRCELWTGGPAILDVEAATLPRKTTTLTPLESSCPLDVTIPVEETDAG